MSFHPFRVAGLIACVLASLAPSALIACKDPAPLDLGDLRHVNVPTEPGRLTPLNRARVVPLDRTPLTVPPRGPAAPQLRPLDRSKIAPVAFGFELRAPWRTPGAERLLIDDLVDVVALIVNDINATLRLPRAVPIDFGACGEPNAFYDPDAPQIGVCLELIELMAGLLSEAYPDDAMLLLALKGSVTFFVLHEMAHALFHELQIANTGNAESAADTLATVLLLQNGGAGIAAAGADAFADLAAWRERTGQPLIFWDEHQFDMQRFFELTCLIYGADPARFGPVLVGEHLPPERARSCPARWADNAASVARQLAPHRR